MSCSLNFWFIKTFQKSKFKNDTPIEKEGYNLIFNDEFHNTTLDTTKWKPKMYYSGPLYPSTKQYWFDPNNITFTNFSIKLKFRKNPKQFTENGSTFTIENSIGLICTEKSFHFNNGEYYLEARIKQPPINGTWTAFWTYGGEGNTYEDPSEIDISEQLSHNKYKFSNNAHITGPRGRNQSPHTKTMSSNLGLDFHRYGVKINSSKLTYYLDGICCYEVVLS